MLKKRIWVFITGILIIIITIFTSERWPETINIFSGIGASIAASLIFWILTDVLQDNSERDFLSTTIKRLENLGQIKSDGMDGLIDIRKREIDATQYWIDFANSTVNKITLSGRTLTRWLEDDNQRIALTNALNRIAKRRAKPEPFDEPIRLVIYSDDGIVNEGNRLGDEILDILIKEKEQIKEFLYKIWSKLSIDERTRFVVYEISHLPYLYCNNGKHCVTGTYFDNRSDKMNLQLVFRCGGDSIEREYTEDFNVMIKKADRLADLTMWRP